MATVTTTPLLSASLRSPSHPHLLTLSFSLRRTSLILTLSFSPKSPFLSPPPLSFSLRRTSLTTAAAINDPIPAASGIKEDGNAFGGEGGGEGEFRVLTAVRSLYNDIVIVETAESRVLLLDDSGNVHSILYKEREWTDSCWDEFVSWPAIIPDGPIAIFGLGGGTAVHLLLRSWPSLQLYGWELDRILIDKARDYFGLSDLEKPTHGGGILHVKIGDALSSSSNIPGGYADIIVDLFAGGKVLPQLEKPETWLELSRKLMANGRIMVNCGILNSVTSDRANEINQPKI